MSELTRETAFRKSEDLGPYLARKALPRIGLIFGALVLGSLATYEMAPWSVIDANEMGFKRRWGVVESAEPLAPGFVWRTPFIENVDVLRVSLDTHHINGLTVYSVDNQPVTIDIAYSYSIPKAAVYHLMYEVGTIGHIDVDSNIEPVVKNLAAQAFAKRNTVKISELRAEIDTELRREVTNALKMQFLVDVLDVQIQGIRYSETFVHSVEAAVQAKNDAVRAENIVLQKKFEGEQRVTAQKADAEVAVAAAEGQKRSAILEAEGKAQARTAQATAEANATVITGNAEAQRIAAIGEATAKAQQLLGQAATANPVLVALELAKHSTGQVPATVIGGTNGLVPLLDLNRLITAPLEK